MKEVTRKFSDVISELTLDDLRRRCNYYEEDEFNEFYFNYNDFVNGYSIIEYGYCEGDYSFGEHKSNIIDTKGSFVEIKLNDEIKYSNGDIIKLNELDKGSYSFEVHRIQELFYRYHPGKGYIIESTKDTAFFYIKVTRDSRNDETRDLYFVINSDLKVIATFTDANKWGVEYDGYKYCEVYTERKFFFINDERNFLIFTQKLIANSDENGFFKEHMYGLDPDLYYDLLREHNGYDGWDDERFNLYEFELDEETLKKVIEKHNNPSVSNDDVEDEEDDETPELEDITFFYEDIDNYLYKDAFSDYYRELFGIINCNVPTDKQLNPFTDSIDYAINIVWDRWRCEKEIRENGHYRYYGNGWDFGNKHFYGYKMSKKFFDYPPTVKGFTLKYVLNYYPQILKRLVFDGIIIIPNKLLNTLEDNELIREIRIEQEIHLDYSSIDSIDNVIESEEKYDLISSFQGKTLKQVIYTKGGTKYLVNLLKYTNFQISKDVLTDLINDSLNQLEINCYNILLNVIEDMEYQEELRQDYIRNKMEEDMLRDINQQFNDMMDDFNAWGNID